MLYVLLDIFDDVLERLGFKFIYVNCLLFIIIVKVMIEDNVIWLGLDCECCLDNYKVFVSMFELVIKIVDVYDDNI